MGVQALDYARKVQSINVISHIVLDDKDGRLSSSDWGVFFFLQNANDRDRGCASPPFDCGLLLAEQTLRCDYQYFHVF
jgi:hypothetical protein